MGLHAEVGSTPDGASGAAEVRLIALVTAAVSILLLLMVAYAGLTMNRSALAMEGRLISKEIDRLVIKTLDEQKSVAIWDEAVRRVQKLDRNPSHPGDAAAGQRVPDANVQWLDDEIGRYLTHTYGHDRVFILDGAGRVIYRYPRTASGDREAADALAAAAPLIREVRGGPQRNFLRREGRFQTWRQTRVQTADGIPMRFAANLLAMDGKPAVISVMEMIPSANRALLSAPLPIVVSMLKVGPDRLAGMGMAVDVKEVRLKPAMARNPTNGIMPLKADDGTPLGWLDWQPVNPGAVLLTIMLPLLAFASAWAVFACITLLRRLMLASQRLRTSEAAARALAHSDPVSGLPNRRAFSAILGERLEGWNKGMGIRPMLACLDLDRFKNVNDTLGHEAGDRLVVAVADRLRAALDGDAVLARLGGDEFAVIAPCDDADAPQRLADQLTALFADPFDITGHHVGITASIGITIAGQGNNSPVMMARYADIALYEAKANRGSTQIFRPEMSHAVERRHSLETELETAIRTGEGLRLVYQPVVPFARRGGSPGVEALLRWTRADGEVVAPDELIPIAEASGQMERLGSWVIDRSFRDAAGWPDMEVSINLSPTQFRAAGLIRYLEGKARTLGINPARIILEVTESLVIETRWNVEQVLHDLRTAGFRIALDDFGTGYSSLSYLRRFPFDRLKLDRSLVQGVTDDRAAMAIVETAAALGLRLGLDVVAEGIETQDEADLMLVAGCTHLQGYLVSRPIEVCDMPRYAALAQESISQAAG